jgi:hypothetical protein
MEGYKGKENCQYSFGQKMSRVEGEDPAIDVLYKNGCSWL